jgi:hypothetical protein
MRVPGEARKVFGQHVVAEIVEQQKRIELLRIPEAERTAEVHAGAFEGRP